MTPQDNRNKRFDEKFGDEFNNVAGNQKIIKTATKIDDVQDFLTSEVNLTIEQVEKWTLEEKNKVDTNHMTHDFKGKCDFERINMANDLLSFLTTLKK